MSTPESLARLLGESVSNHVDGYVRTDADHELLGQVYVEGFIDLRAVVADLLAALPDRERLARLLAESIKARESAHYGGAYVDADHLDDVIVDGHTNLLAVADDVLAAVSPPVVNRDRKCGNCGLSCVVCTVYPESSYVYVADDDDAAV